MTITISKKLKPINPSDFICVVYHGSGGGVDELPPAYRIDGPQLLYRAARTGGEWRRARMLARGLCCWSVLLNVPSNARLLCGIGECL